MILLVLTLLSIWILRSMLNLHWLVIVKHQVVNLMVSTQIVCGRCHLDPEKESIVSYLVLVEKLCVLSILLCLVIENLLVKKEVNVRLRLVLLVVAVIVIHLIVLLVILNLMKRVSSSTRLLSTKLSYYIILRIIQYLLTRRILKL